MVSPVESIEHVGVIPDPDSPHDHADYRRIGQLVAHVFVEEFGDTLRITTNEHPGQGMTVEVQNHDGRRLLMFSIRARSTDEAIDELGFGPGKHCIYWATTFSAAPSALIEILGLVYLKIADSWTSRFPRWFEPIGAGMEVPDGNTR